MCQTSLVSGIKDQHPKTINNSSLMKHQSSQAARSGFLPIQLPILPFPSGRWKSCS